MATLQSLYLTVFSLFGLYLFFRKKLYKKKSHKQFFLLITILLLTGIIASHVNLGQNLISASLGSFSIFYGYSIFIFIAWESNGLKFEKVFKIILLYMWIYLGITVIFSLIGFQGVYVSPLSGNELEIHPGKFSKLIFWFGLCYFFVKFILKDKLRYLLYVFLIFLGTQVQDIQRGDFIVSFLVFLFILYKFRSRNPVKKIILFSPFLLLPFIIFFSNSNLSKQIAEKFNPVARLVNNNTGKIDDSSIAIRIIEFNYAIENIYKSPFFGNGLIRSSEKEKLIGNIYFYKGDIGIVGVLYCFGIMGLLIYFLYWKILLKKFRNYQSVLYNSIFFYLIFLMVYSLKDGNVMYNPANFIFFLLILEVYDLKFDEIQKIKLFKNN